MRKKNIVASGVLALASRAAAQVASVCTPSNNEVCYKLNIPANTASSGEGDIFFQISGPSDYEWVALGQGTRMSNGNIFVVYTSGDGKNVTLSPRLGTGYSMPNYNSNAQVTLLEGSGVSDGKMIANVKCSNCHSWAGNSADFQDSKGSWLYAYKTGGPKNSDDQRATINQHNQADPFSWDYANAKGGDSVNPLVNSAPSGTSSGDAGGSATTSCVPRPTTGSFASDATNAPTVTSDMASATDTDDGPTAPWDRPGRPTGFPGRPTAAPTGPPYLKRQEINYCDSDSNPSNGNDNGNTLMPIGFSGRSNRNKMLAAHAVLAALAFVLFFPAGAIAIRLASFPGVVWFHAVFQAFAYLVYIAAFALGVKMANDLDMLDHHHAIIGIVLFIALFLQPILGLLHHSGFKKFGHRTMWSYGHLWLGRSVITLGIINGGLGFRLAKTLGNYSRSGMIAYSVIAAIMWLAMVAAAVMGEMRRRRDGVPSGRPPKYEMTPSDRSPVEENRIPTPPAPRANGYYGPGNS